MEASDWRGAGPLPSAEEVRFREEGSEERAEGGEVHGYYADAWFDHGFGGLFVSLGLLLWCAGRWLGGVV